MTGSVICWGGPGVKVTTNATQAHMDGCRASHEALVQDTKFVCGAETGQLPPSATLWVCPGR